MMMREAGYFWNGILIIWIIAQLGNTSKLSKKEKVEDIL
jgi:hypothetical protein